MRALTWRAAVAVVAVALVAGACGNSDGGSGGDGGLRKLPLGAVGAGRSSATMASEAAADASAMVAPRFQAVEYRLADDAESVPETATAYELEPLPADEVRDKVAKALDVDADQVEVGSGGYDWYYSGVSPDTAVSSSPACAPDEKCIDEAPSPRPTVPGVPSASEAEQRVKDILESLGASTEGRFEVFGEDGYNRSVVFTPEVDGLSVAGLQTQVAFGGGGRIEYANGLFAEVKAIGEYPLVGLDEAVKRLQEGFGNGGVRTMGAPEPDIATDPAVEDSAARTEGPTSDDASGGSSTGSTGATSGGSSTGTAGGGSSGSTGSAGSCAATADGTAYDSGSGSASGTASSAPCTDPPPPAPTCAPDEPCSTPPAPPADEPTMTIEPDPGIPSEEPLEPQIVEITGAELSLQIVAAGCPGDPVYLVPTFDLQSEPGPAGSVIAVEDEVIAGQGSADDQDFEPCPDQGDPDVPVGKPEPAPMPADTGREPANP